MCRYSYLSGACANKHVESLVCDGEEDCEHSEMNVLTKSRPTGTGECGPERWLGLYCEKHRKFYCPGKEECPFHSPNMLGPRRPSSFHIDRGD